MAFSFIYNAMLKIHYCILTQVLFKTDKLLNDSWKNIIHYLHIWNNIRPWAAMFILRTFDSYWWCDDSIDCQIWLHLENYIKNLSFFVEKIRSYVLKTENMFSLTTRKVEVYRFFLTTITCNVWANINYRERQNAYWNSF